MCTLWLRVGMLVQVTGEIILIESAREQVRKFWEELQSVEALENEDFMSAVESVTSTSYGSCCGEQSDIANIDDFEDEEDEFYPFALPCEGTARLPCWKGTRERAPGKRRLCFLSNAVSVCPPGQINVGLIDGTSVSKEQKIAHAYSLARAIARARRQQSHVISEESTSVRQVFYEATPPILF